MVKKLSKGQKVLGFFIVISTIIAITGAVNIWREAFKKVQITADTTIVKRADHQEIWTYRHNLMATHAFVFEDGTSVQFMVSDGYIGSFIQGECYTIHLVKTEGKSGWVMANGGFRPTPDKCQNVAPTRTRPSSLPLRRSRGIPYSDSTI